ncbi:facilitated trehalose transporter Tret1-like [Cherax quadricarinatus]|uniref:facilitated trehalose transporter Tret1-like n=1 Tax=Cherax quadricarinatus TaxID=27406 RepID=UPI00387E6685
MTCSFGNGMRVRCTFGNDMSLYVRARSARCHSPTSEGLLEEVGFAHNLSSKNERSSYVTITPLFPQVFATLVMALTQLSAGTSLAFSGITLPQLTDPQENLFLNQSQTAFFGSLEYLGAAVGCCVSGPLLVKLGRRVTLLVTLPITAASWLSLALSPTVWLLLTSRSILGITGGIILTATFLYSIEIAHKNIRGILSGIITLARIMGLIMVSILGFCKLDWRQMGFVCCGVSVIPFFCLIFLPNSPRWLVTQGRLSEAQKALVFFRSKHYDSEPELQDITQQIINVDKKLDNSWQQLRLLFEPSTARTFLLLTVLSLFASMNGSHVIMSYSVPIFQAVDFTLDPYISAIIFYGVRIFGNLVYLFAIDRYVSDMGWIPLTATMIFIFFIGIGQPAILILNGELLPLTCRSIGNSALSLTLTWKRSREITLTTGTIQQDSESNTKLP